MKIESDPMFVSWNRPMPRLWYSDQRQATQLAGESLYGSSLYASFYGRTSDDALASPLDEAIAAVVGFYRDVTEEYAIGSDTASRTATYARSASDALTLTDSASATKGGSGVVQPPVHEMVPGTLS